MPAKLNVNRETVKTLAVVHGIREAARISGLPEATVQAWSARFGWLREKRLIDATNCNQVSPSDALQSVADKTKQALAKAGHRAADHFAGLAGAQVVEQSGHYKNIVTAAAQLHGWDQRFAGQAFTLNVLNIGSCGIEIGDKSQT